MAERETGRNGEHISQGQNFFDQFPFADTLQAVANQTEVNVPVLRVALAMIGTQPAYRLVRAGQRADGSPISRWDILKVTDVATHFLQPRRKTKNIDELREDVRDYFKRDKENKAPDIEMYTNENFDRAMEALFSSDSPFSLEKYKECLEYIHDNYRKRKPDKRTVAWWSYEYDGRPNPRATLASGTPPTYQAWLAGNRR